MLGIVGTAGYVATVIDVSDIERKDRLRLLYYNKSRNCFRLRPTGIAFVKHLMCTKQSEDPRPPLKLSFAEYGSSKLAKNGWTGQHGNGIFPHRLHCGCSDASTQSQAFVFSRSARVKSQVKVNSKQSEIPHFR